MTHVCEVIVLRYVTNDWQIKQKVGRLMLLAKSMTGEEVARQIITVLSTEMGVPCHLVVTAMHDRASVNIVAMRIISILYKELMDIGCFSHTLDLVGDHMKIPILDEFVKSWDSPFSHSPKSRLLFGRLKQDYLQPLTQLPDGGVSLKLFVNYSTCLVMYRLS